jgi:nucleoside-diphosphate-sugar epimerase
MKRLLILGCGYVGGKLAEACIARGMEVAGATRSKARAKELNSLGVHAALAESPDLLTDDFLSTCDAVLDSIPLQSSEQGLRAGQTDWVAKLAPRLKHISWLGYLSSTGVYGDADGAWVDESWPCRPGSVRGRERLLAESAWLHSGLPAEVFRLAGIYGPERNILARLMTGGYKAVDWNPPRFSSRIHVDDIVAALLAAMDRPRIGRIMNLADDNPSPHFDYVSQLARMIGAPAPVRLTAEQAKSHLSPAALSFFTDNRRVSNRLLHRELLSDLKYPGFRDGFSHLAQA